MDTAKDKITCVLCHHTGELIERCLKSIEGYDVVVVTSDQNYKRTTERLVIYTGINNPSFKRNLGSQFTNRPYIAFLDDDTEMEYYGTLLDLQTMLDSFDDLGMVYGTLYKMDDHEKLDTAGAYLSWNGFLYEDYHAATRPVLASKSALCMVRRDLFESVGKFDESFFIYGEETDLSWRIWRAGFEVWTVEGAVGYHAFETIYKPKTYYNPYFIHFHGCKNYLTMLLKNLPRRRLYVALLNALSWFTMAVLFFPKNKTASKYILAGIWYNIRNFKLIMKKRTGNFAIPNCLWKNPPLSYYLTRINEYLTHELHG